jgi:hypothetical protein
MGGSSQHSTMPGTHGTNRTQPGRVKMVANGLNRDNHHNHHCVAWSMALPLYWYPCVVGIGHTGVPVEGERHGKSKS